MEVTTNFIRVTDNGENLDNFPAYQMAILPIAGVVNVNSNSSGQLLQVTGLTILNGDIFTLAVVGTTLYLLQNGTQIGSVTNATFSSGITAIYMDAFDGTADTKISNFAMGSASVATYSISGNAGVADATVSYSGTASGSVIADGSGNFTISGLGAGSYTITPSLAYYTLVRPAEMKR